MRFWGGGGAGKECKFITLRGLGRYARVCAGYARVYAGVCAKASPFIDSRPLISALSSRRTNLITGRRFQESGVNCTVNVRIQLAETRCAPYDRGFGFPVLLGGPPVSSSE